jgi:Flp pilus assembly protein TadD
MKLLGKKKKIMPKNCLSFTDLILFMVAFLLLVGGTKAAPVPDANRSNTGRGLTSSFAQSRGNVISGFVFDAATRAPVPGVYVELMNDVYSTLSRAKTDGTGRFRFNGLSSGTFKIKVLPYGTNYLEEVQDVTIVNNSFGSGTVVTSDHVYLDIYLKLDKRKANSSEFYPPGSVFVQNIPQAARDFYKKGSAQLQNPKEADLGLENLKKALEIFPDYYDALDRLGIEYVRRHQYFESLPHLIKAIQINQRSFSSFYALGLAAYNLKQMKEAVEAFRSATILNKQSVYARLQHGRALRIVGNYKQAEDELVKAKTLSKDSPIGEIHWQLGLLYEKLERYNEAASELESFLKTQSDITNVQQIKDLIAKLRTKAQK